MKKMLLGLSLVALSVASGPAVFAQDLQKGAADILKPLAEQGNAEAQYNLGLMYAKGDRGVPRDYNEAATWWRLAAEQGDVRAQKNLGLMYKIGGGVPQSKVMAHVWYNIASANGHPRAGKWRDELTDKMTSAEISVAQRMAVECMSSNYDNCGW